MPTRTTAASAPRALDAAEELAATSEATVIATLQAAFVGYDSFSDAWDAPEATEVDPRYASIGGPRAITAYVVSTPDYPLATERLVLAERTANGTRVIALETGSTDRTDHGHSGGGGVESLDMRWEGALLVIDLHLTHGEGYMSEAEAPTDAPEGTACYEESEETWESFLRVVCLPDPSDLRCFALDLGSGTTSRLYMHYCNDAEGAPVPSLRREEGEPLTTVPRATVTLRSDGATLVTAAGERREVRWAELTPLRFLGRSDEDAEAE